MREVREGRGSPKAAVFLESPGSSQKCQPPEHTKRSSRACTIVKQLAEIDITAEPRRWGRPLLCVGACALMATQMSTLPGLFAAGEAAAGLTARIASAEIRCRILWCLECARRVRSEYAAETTSHITSEAVEDRRKAERAFWRAKTEAPAPAVSGAAHTSGHDAGPRWNCQTGGRDAARS